MGLVGSKTRFSLAFLQVLLGCLSSNCSMNGSATVSKFPSHPIFVFICRGTNQPSIAFESQSLPVLQPSPISVSVMVPQLLSMSMIFSFRTNGDDLSDKVAKSDSFTFP